MNSPVMEIPSGPVIFKSISVSGFWGSKVMGGMDGAKRAALLGELITRISEGSLTLPVEEIYSFDDARKASAANFVAGRGGKVLLRP
jgi:NADPH:quinone reductase-like Zn-dependent oxidoreductase